MMTFGAFAMRHLPTPLPVDPTAPPPPSQAVLFGVLLAFSLLTAAFGAWQIVTVVGLIRLRSWARYSVLVIGGILTFLGAISLLSVAAAGFLMPRLMAQTSNPQAPPHLMQFVLLASGLIYGAIASVGIWWLVYFNLRATKQAFSTAYAIDPVFYAGEPGDPQLYRGTGRFARTPTSVMVIGWLFLFSGVCCLGFCWLPFPAYLMGVILTGFLPHLLFLAFAVVAGLIGWGLLRLDNRARLGAYGLMVYGLVNFAVMLTPWGRGRYAEYQSMLNARIGVSVHQPQLFDPTSFCFILAMVLMGILFYAVQIWILEKHKRAFTSAPPPLA